MCKLNMDEFFKREKLLFMELSHNTNKKYPVHPLDINKWTNFIIINFEKLNNEENQEKLKLMFKENKFEEKSIQRYVNDVIISIEIIKEIRGEA